MRKCTLFLLVVLLLCPFAASAAEQPQYIGLAFRGFPDGSAGSRLLDAMAQRDARATFFLDVPSREQGQRILDGGHEIGLTVTESWNRLSRREVYQQLNDFRRSLPPCKFSLLLADRKISDGVRQVAEVQKMTFLQNARNARVEASAGMGFLRGMKSGDILLLDGENPEQSLYMMDFLQNRGFRLVAVSELSRFDRR